MEKEITRSLIAFFGAASLSLLSVTPLPPSDVSISTDHDSDNDSVLSTDIEYTLQVVDRTRYDINDSLSWSISNLYMGPRGYFLNNTVKEHTFTDTGTYVLQAFKDMRMIACDTVLVGLGESFNVAWPNRSEFISGSTVSAEDLSTRVDSRKWKVTHAGIALDLPAPDAATLQWEPVDTGLYGITIEVNLASGKVKHDEKSIRVVEAPREPIVKPVPPPPAPEPKKDTWKPKPDAPAPVPSNGAACFVNHKLEGSPFVVPVDKPTRDRITNWSDAATVFTFSPKYDCMFTGFDYFTKGQIDDIEITVKCENPLCVGTATFKTKRKGGYDANSFVHLDFQSLPILNKDFKYTITVRAMAPGKLGFFPINSNIFKSEKAGNSYKGIDGSLTFKNESMETCVFNLRFTR